MDRRARLLIVHRVRVFRECLGSALARRGFEVVELLEDIDDSLATISWSEADSALIDANLLNDRASQLTTNISSNLPRLKVLIIDLAEAESLVLKYIEAGASGYVSKDASIGELVETINLVCRGEARCSQRIAYSTFARAAELVHERRIREMFRTEDLTLREVEILQSLAEKLTNREIAERLYVSVHTVKNHVHNILDKLRVTTRSDAVCYGIDRGYVS